MDLGPGALVSPNVRLERLLGRGGMGSVWVATHLGLQTAVAVKLISTEVGEGSERAARFGREAAIAAKLRSPHVVQLFDHGLAPGGVPYIVMELLEGESLGDRLGRGERLGLSQTALLVSQVSQVLGEAHALGIVHRDIKPGNLFLLRSRYEVFVKVLDFGIAKQAAPLDGPSVTATGAFLGSPRYMSPEQMGNARSIDGRADLWSLAVVAYEALAGVPAFEGDSVGAVIVEVMSARHRPPSAHGLGLPAELDRWFERALHPDISKRFQSADELAASFATVAGGGDLGRVPSGAPLVAVGPTQAPTATHDLPRSEPVPAADATSVATKDGAAAPVPVVAARRRAWPLVVAGGVVAGLVGGAVVLLARPSGDRGPEGRPSATGAELDRSAPPDAPRARAVGTGAATPSATPSATAVAAPSSSVDLAASTASAARSPAAATASSTAPAGVASGTTSVSAAPPASATSTGSTTPRGVGAAQGEALYCWSGNEGYYLGTPASSATITVSFSSGAQVRGVAVAGSAASFPGFVRCCGSRLQGPHLWKIGDAPTATFTLGLPAGTHPRENR